VAQCGIRQRFGAVKKHGSLSVVERLIRTIKNECTRKLIVPYERLKLRRGQRLGLCVTHLAGREHLPIVELKKAT